jgi:ATP adenylyltransferase/5',5'''-P-1,P-4-tetraphosphate phosphorylase II
MEALLLLLHLHLQLLPLPQELTQRRPLLNHLDRLPHHLNLPLNLPLLDLDHLLHPLATSSVIPYDPV